MGTDVGGIDVVVKKKPSGSGSTIHLVNSPTGYVLQSVESTGTPAEIQMLRNLGPLVGGLLTGDITGATITPTANGQVRVNVTQRAVKVGGINNLL